MNGRRLRAIWRRVVLEVRHDHPSLALLFVAPIVLTGLLAFIIREGQSATVHAVVVNGAGLPGAAVAKSLEAALVSGGVTVTTAADEGAARGVVDRGEAGIAIVLPADLAGTVAAGGSPTITVITKGVDVSSDGAQVGALQKALPAVVAGLVGGAARAPTLHRVTIYGSPNADTVDVLAPAIIGFFAYFFVYMLTGVSFLRERTGGTLERLLATPVARGEIVGGYTLGFGLFATLQVALLIIWSLLNIQVPAIGPLPAFSIGLAIPCAGPPVLAFLVVLLAALGAVSLGIFLSTFARTELQIVQFIPLVIVPQVLLSGVLFPVSTLPAILQPLSALMPLTYAVDGLRQVFIRGADLSASALQVDLLVLTGFACFFALIAARTIRREVA
jgi:ABC-2 type transport system permease protein